MIKAVLFDMDGTLVNTEVLSVETVKNFCKEINLEIAPGGEERVIGITFRKFYKELFEEYQRQHPLEQALDRNNELYEQLLRDKCDAFEGAQSLPGILKSRGLKIGLVSGSRRKQIDMILESLDIDDHFDVIVSADDIENSKPDPEGYLKAAKAIAVLPEECLVLEDSESGVAAGKAAGMKVVGIVHNGGQDISRADIKVDRLIEIERNLDNFINESSK